MGAITLGLALALLTSHTSAQLPYERFNSDLLPEYAENTFLPVEPAAPTVLSAAEEAAGVMSSKRLSLSLRPESKSSVSLPSWCIPASERKAGPWHLLSDDEYTNESPYLLCGLPEKGLKPGHVQRPSQRRAAHGKGTSSWKSPPCAGLYQMVSMHLLTRQETWVKNCAQSSHCMLTSIHESTA